MRVGKRNFLGGHSFFFSLSTCPCKISVTFGEHETGDNVKQDR